MRSDAAEEIWYARLQEARCYWALGDRCRICAPGDGLVKTAPEPRRAAIRPRALPPRTGNVRDSGGFRRGRARTRAPPGDDAKFVEELRLSSWDFRRSCQSQRSIAPIPLARNAASRRATGSRSTAILRLTRAIGRGGHLRFYATPAAELMPSFMARPVGFKPPVGWHATRPSVSRSGDEIILIQRVVNSAPEEGDRRSPNGALFATSRDFLLQLNSALDLEASSEILPPQDVQPFENIRLLCWRGALWCSAILRELTPEGQCQQVLARIDESGDGQHRLTDCRVFLPRGAAAGWGELDAARRAYSCRGRGRAAAIHFSLGSRAPR